MFLTNNFTPTGSNARKILKLEKVIPCQFDQSIIDLAKTDLIETPYNEKISSCINSINDFSARCVVLEDKHNNGFISSLFLIHYFKLKQVHINLNNFLNKNRLIEILLDFCILHKIKVNVISKNLLNLNKNLLSFHSNESEIFLVDNSYEKMNEQYELCIANSLLYRSKNSSELFFRNPRIILIVEFDLKYKDINYYMNTINWKSYNNQIVRSFEQLKLFDSLTITNKFSYQLLNAIGFITDLHGDIYDR